MYKVLWFDDDFSEEDIYDEKIILRRQSFQLDAEQAGEFDIEYDPACTFDEFEKKLQTNENVYQAVIFDLKGLNPNDSSDNSVFFKAEKLLRTSKGIIKYVYSNNIDKPDFKVFLEVNFSKGNVFSKAMDCKRLFEKIKCDLDEALDCYQEHIECLLLFNKLYLSGNNRGKMDIVMKDYKEKNESVNINCLRTIIEDMMDHLASIIPNMPQGPKKYNEKVKYIARECYKNINGDPDFNNPKMPFCECPEEVKRCLEFSWNMCNLNSHNQSTNLNIVFPSNYKSYIKDAIFNSFFVTMIWYYGYMTNLMSNE